MADHERDVRVRRAAPRRKLFQPAELRHADKVQRVHLLDLSTSGGLVHMAQPPATGTIVTVTCGLVTRSARIAWSAGSRIGVAFIRPLSEPEVEAVILAGIDPGPSTAPGLRPFGS